MFKFISVVFLFTSFIAFSTTTSFAAVVTVDEAGSVFWNVLPAYDEVDTSPQPDSLEVKNVAINGTTSDKSKISLTNNSGIIELIVNDGNITKEAEITNFDQEIVEIEQKELPKRISIVASGNGFLLKEQNVTAFTSFPITVEPEEKRIIVGTPSGQQYLKELPSDVLTQAIKGQIIDVVGDGYLVITSGDQGQVYYLIEGMKTLNILNIFRYEVPVSANISASDGKVISIQQPFWLPIASFLFS